MLSSMNSSVPLVTATAEWSRSVEGLDGLGHVVGKQLDQDGGAGAAGGDRHLAVRDADEVAAGHGRAVYRRVGQNHVLVRWGRQINREGDVSARTLGHRPRRAVHGYSRRGCGDGEVGGAQGDARVEGSERDAV